MGIEQGGFFLEDQEKNKNDLETILSPEQFKFLEKEKAVRELTLSSDGKINASEENQAIAEKVQLWKSKEGVIDVSSLDGILMVVYNSGEKVPEGCRDLRTIESHGGKSRAGEYNPEDNVCSIDISGTYSFLEDKYRAEWVQQTMRHELRHGLVNHEDIKYGNEIGKPSRRDFDEKLLNPEDYVQLTYLDELHSQYFDVLEGDIEGKNSFRTIESDFYTTAGSGNHSEISSGTEEGKESAKEIFYILQGFIISKRMTEKESHSEMSEKIDEMSMAAGVVLATERSLSRASDKIKKIWNKLVTNEEFKNKISQFLKEYKPEPTGANNTPELEGLPSTILNK
ncbi:MAG: hypothetical protein WC938_01745 [Candidatus Paceibacterota bacterium]|jgi:hypothetical protein